MISLVSDMGLDRVPISFFQKRFDAGEMMARGSYWQHPGLARLTTVGSSGQTTSQSITATLTEHDASAAPAATPQPAGTEAETATAERVIVTGSHIPTAEEVGPIRSWTSIESKSRKPVNALRQSCAGGYRWKGSPESRRRIEATVLLPAPPLSRCADLTPVTRLFCWMGVALLLIRSEPHPPVG
jgi:hypothetical protein